MRPRGVRLPAGVLLSALLMFLIGFLAWATPAKWMGFSSANPNQLVAVQTALTTNLPHTGRYMIPDPDAAGSAEAYRAGPIATVDFNTAGFAPVDAPILLKGFLHYLIVAALLAAALQWIAGVFPTLRERMKVACCLTGAATVLTLFSDPIYDHHDWRFAAYAFAIYLLMLWSASFVLIRWFVTPIGRNDQALNIQPARAKSTHRR